ncbi:MAG: NAD-dependent dehydratase [Thiobacillus sp. SCN 64-35]|uniref:UDP-glucose 4-epimerase family protein n=1 Tax=Thiobacillus sp. 0-1251 TaxID=1895858 RepID=UPI00086BDA87|nr:SDR family oxidoreductase [Thiobacillus sp. 0-1251]ODU14638.1 MAG: NAD-dependent dehydratase [Thiobacillus sp. SCN 64-35]OJY60342.1 MAG: NAD-dependent dehydratase [Thiobacillus sp. 0-1251]
MKVLVTGASGFVGRELCVTLLRSGHSVRGALRQIEGRVVLLEGVEPVAVGAINAATDWKAALAGCDTVVHLAARVHVMDYMTSDPLAEFREVNSGGTLNLSSQAAHAGVKRFVFVSTVKVNGEGRDDPYRETDPPAPEDAYAISKWEAEQGLRRVAQETGMEVVILRPPLVYGPAVKANFLQLMRTVERGWPLPLGAIRNRRSLLYLGNLVDAIRVCVEHPAAAGQTFLLDDGEPISTTGLVRALARAMGRPARLLAVPVGVLELAGALLGKRAAVMRLVGSLYVDSSAIRTRLDWTPPYSMEEGLAATVASST